MLPSTEEIRIETSTICNFNCTFCPRDSFRRKQMTMENSLFKDILLKTKQQMPGIRFLSITGYGEFSADSNWMDKIETASSIYSKIHLITNLSLLDSSHLDFILEHVTDIRVSAYAMDNLVYQSVHNPPAGVTLENITGKILYLIKNKGSRHKIILNYIETELNRKDTDKWIEFWKERADLLEVWRPHNWINGRKFRGLCSHREPSCYRPFFGPVQVLVDGTVNICCFDYNGEMVIGDLKKQDLHDIFTGRKINEVRSLHKRNMAHMVPLCSLCDQRNCIDCRSRELIFNTHFNKKERVAATAADFDGRLE